MKIALISVGTRGDMEPFIAVEELLKQKGHKVICGFPEQFIELADQSNLPVETLGAKFIDLLESEDGQAAMGGASGLKKIIGTLRLAIHQSEANKSAIYKSDPVPHAVLESYKNRHSFTGWLLYKVPVLARFLA